MNLAVEAARGFAESLVAGRSIAALRAYQLRRLRRVVRHAWEEVPFQRRRLEAAGLSPDELRSLEDLSRLPPISRAEVQAQPPRDLVPRRLDPDRMLSILTSGSTGEPLQIRRTLAGKRLQGLLRLRLLGRMGVRPTDHLARIVNVRPRGPGEGRVAGAFERLGLFRVSSVSCMPPAEEILDELRRLRPDVLTGFPSVVAEVAALGPRRRGLAPRLVLLGGEVVEPHVRRRIAEAFEAPVLDGYSCFEAGILAWECPRAGELHVHGEGVLLEVLDGDRPVGPGESGEVVVTSLHGLAMPFLRYRLGDVATRGEEFCRCGQPYPTLRAIQGRRVDLFPLADGRLLNPYELLAAMYGQEQLWIRRYQLVQERPDRVRLRLVLAPDAPVDAGHRLGAAVARVLGPAVSLRVDVVDAIPPDERTGKVRPMRSLVPR